MCDAQLRVLSLEAVDDYNTEVYSSWPVPCQTYSYPPSHSLIITQVMLLDNGVTRVSTACHL